MLIALEVTGLLVVLAVAMVEVGFRIGHHHADVPEAERTEARALQGATLGLLALIFGFTLAMASDRFGQRRALIIDEVNSIRRAHTLASLLPPPHAAQTGALLRSYMIARHEYSLAGSDDERTERATQQSRELQEQIAAHALAVSRDHPEWELASLYPNAVEQMTDLERERAFAGTKHMPPTIYGLLLMLLATGMGITGYASGLSRTRSLLASVVLPVLTAMTCSMIIDLDHPRAGFIRVRDVMLEQLMRDADR